MRDGRFYGPQRHHETQNQFSSGVLHILRRSSVRIKVHRLRDPPDPVSLFKIISPILTRQGETGRHKRGSYSQDPFFYVWCLK